MEVVFIHPDTFQADRALKTIYSLISPVGITLSSTSKQTLVVGIQQETLYIHSTAGNWLHTQNLTRLGKTPGLSPRTSTSTTTL